MPGLQDDVLALVQRRGPSSGKMMSGASMLLRGQGVVNLDGLADGDARIGRPLDEQERRVHAIDVRHGRQLLHRLEIMGRVSVLRRPENAAVAGAVFRMNVTRLLMPTTSTPAS